MNSKTVKKILVIISIIILVLGIIKGINIMNNVENTASSSDLTIDGADFSGVVELGGYIGNQLVGVITIAYSIFLDIIIWVIYGIVILIIKLIDKIRKKEDLKE